MANIEKRPDGVWRARYYDDGGKQHARHFARKVDAKSWLDTVTASVVRGDYTDPKTASTLLRTYAAQWEKVQVGRGSTLSIIDNAVRLHINPSLGDRRIGSIRQSDIQGLVKMLESKDLCGRHSAEHLRHGRADLRLCRRRQGDPFLAVQADHVAEGRQGRGCAADVGSGKGARSWDGRPWRGGHHSGGLWSADR
jgi:hypothetical protein